MSIYSERKKAFIKQIERMGGKYRPCDIFRDFCFMARLALANLTKDPELDAEYNRLLARYDNNVKPFQELLAIAVDAYEHQFGDFLGECYEELGAQNFKAGQFFTPYSVSKAMAEITITKEDVLAAIERDGYFSMNDCACGAGCTLIAGLDVLKTKHGINYQQKCLVVAQDVDDFCAAMCYIQLALLGAPAVVITGDTLTLEISKQWYTPFYQMFGWHFKEQRKHRERRQPQEETADEQILETCKVALELEEPPAPAPVMEASGQMAFNF